MTAIRGLIVQSTTLLIYNYTLIMKMLTIHLILLAASCSVVDTAVPPTFTCNVTAYDSSNCTGQQLGHHLLDPLLWYDVPCGDGYDATFMECCVLPNATTTLPLNTTTRIAISALFFSCTRDETPSFNFYAHTRRLLTILLATMVPIILVLAAWCYIRYYRRSKRSTREHQEDSDDDW